jgi:calcium-independent phospholipase A2
VYLFSSDNLCAVTNNFIITVLLQATLSEGRPVDRACAWCNMIGVPFFRFSPQLSEDVGLDCTDDQTLINMLWETQCYINEHRERFTQLASVMLS